jgi:hypothetical protein
VGWLHVVTIQTAFQRAPAGAARTSSGACSPLGKAYTSRKEWSNRCCAAQTCWRSSCGSGFAPDPAGAGGVAPAVDVHGRGGPGRRCRPSGGGTRNIARRSRPGKRARPAMTSPTPSMPPPIATLIRPGPRARCDEEAQQARAADQGIPPTREHRITPARGVNGTFQQPARCVPGELSNVGAASHRFPPLRPGTLRKRRMPSEKRYDRRRGQVATEPASAEAGASP